jgi:hypothetical protein
LPSSLPAIMQALADQIETELGGVPADDPVIPGLQVVSLLESDPTPPAIDIYPANPFQEGIAFGRGNVEIFLTVRARVTTADQGAGQLLLLSMMDPNAAESVALAITSDRTFSNTVEDAIVTGPTDFGVFVDAGGGGALLGCTWTVQITP